MSVAINDYNRKLHTGFRLIPTSITLNDLERRDSPYFAFFSPNSIDFQADYVRVVEDRPIIYTFIHHQTMIANSEKKQTIIKN